VRRRAEERRSALRREKKTQPRPRYATGEGKKSRDGHALQLLAAMAGEGNSFLFCKKRPAYRRRGRTEETPRLFDLDRLKKKKMPLHRKKGEGKCRRKRPGKKEKEPETSDRLIVEIALRPGGVSLCGGKKKKPRLKKRVARAAKLRGGHGIPNALKEKSSTCRPKERGRRRVAATAAFSRS